MATAGEILDDARIWLNDQASLQWTNAILLPVLKVAVKELTIHLAEVNFPYLREISVDTAVAQAVNDIAGPTDLIYPIKLEEKPAGSSDDNYREIEQLYWEGSELEPIEYIDRWAWRKQRFYFNPHTSDREVRIFYLAMLTNIVDANTQVLVNLSEVVLSKRVAALAARNLGSNPTRADALDAEVAYFMAKLINIQIKTQQSMPVRRQGYKFRRGLRLR